MYVELVPSSRRAPARLVCAGLIAAALWISACTSSGDGGLAATGNDDGAGACDGWTQIEDGTISNLEFDVIDGAVYQEEENGTICADEDGGMIAFDDNTGNLGLTDEDQIQLRSNFSLELEGTLTVYAYGEESDQFAGGLWAELSRDDTNVFYGTGKAADESQSGTFESTDDPGAEFAVVMEFYKDTSAGWGGEGNGAGLGVWELSNLDPVSAGEVGQGHWSGEFAEGDETGYALYSSTLSGVEVVPDVVGITD